MTSTGIVRLLIRSAAVITLLSGATAHTRPDQMPADSIVVTPYVYSLGAEIGVNDFHQKDTYLSPYIYRGPLLLTRLSFHAMGTHSRHTVDAWFSRGQIDSELQPRDVTQTLGKFSYFYLYSVYSHETLGHPFEVLAGAGLSTTIINTDFLAVDHVFQYQLLDRSWYWAHSLDVHASLDYRFEARTRGMLRCSVPIFQLVSRPANGHYFEERNAKIADNFLKAATGGYPQYLWNDPDLSGEIKVLRQVGEHVEIQVSYMFGVVSTDRPMHSSIYMNEFLAGFLVQL